MSAGRSRHGLRVARAKVMLQGIKALDQRSAAARMFVEHRNELINALGGQQLVSPQQRGLIEMGARLRLLIDAGYAWVFGQRGLVNGRRRAFLPIVGELRVMSETYVRIIERLGLDRVAPPAKSLQDIAREIAEQKARPRDTQEGPQSQEGVEAAGHAAAPRLRA